LDGMDELSLLMGIVFFGMIVMTLVCIGNLIWVLIN